jgi:hypothetical protein
LSIVGRASCLCPTFQTEKIIYHREHEGHGVNTI